MTLDATARRANVKDSIKKWAVDNIETTTRPVTFDKWLSAPNIAGGVAHKWVSLKLGPIQRDYLGEIKLDIYCCVRNDPEGFKLAQLTDNVMAQLSDTDRTDGMKRIVFYQSAVAIADWVIKGALIVQDVKESGDLEAADATKYAILSCRLRTAMKI